MNVEPGMDDCKIKFVEVEEHNESLTMEFVTAGRGLTRTNTLSALPGGHPKAVGKTTYFTVCGNRSVLVKTWLIVSPDPFEKPDTNDEAEEAIHVKVVPGTCDKIATSVSSIEQIVGADGLK